MIKRVDFIFIVAVIIAATIMLFISGFLRSGQVAVVYINGVEQHRFDLQIDNKITISQEYENKIEIADGGIRVSEANCPDKTCVKQGKISKSGQVIVCLPNRMTIEILGKKPTDVIIYSLLTNLSGKIHK